MVCISAITIQLRTLASISDLGSLPTPILLPQLRTLHVTAYYSDAFELLARIHCPNLWTLYVDIGTGTSPELIPHPHQCLLTFLAGSSHDLIAFKFEAMKELPRDFLPALFRRSPPLDIQPVIEALEETEATNKDVLCFTAPFKAMEDADPAPLCMEWMYPPPSCILSLIDCEGDPDICLDTSFSKD